MAIADVINGIHRACQDSPVSAALILCFLRHLSEEEAFETLEDALPHREKFIGIGLDSSKWATRPRNSRACLPVAASWACTAAHAGEEGPPAYIRTALDDLKVERIDHGVRCLEDADLTARLAREQIALRPSAPLSPLAILSMVW